MLYNKHNLTVAGFASTSDIRPEIASVLFTSKKTVATDSYQLLEVATPAEISPEDFPTVGGNIPLTSTEPFMVNAKTIKGIKIKKTKGLPILENICLAGRTPEGINFVSTDLEGASVTSGRIVDGTFPDYEQVFPTDAPACELLINGRMVGELLQAIAGMRADEHVTLKVYGQYKPIVILGGGENQPARGMVMPVQK